MGLLNSFGGALGGLFGEGFADRAAIAGALVNGDYGAASAMKARQAAIQAEKEKERQAREGMLHAYGAFKAMGMSDDQAITLASDPSVAANFVADRNKKQQYSASGGSSFDPVSNQWQMAPSRHEFQGSVFDVGGASPGQQAPVTLQHQGVQWVTPQPGTTAFGVDSFTGLPMGGSGAAPQQPAPAAPAPSAATNDLRAQAIDAIKRGADPAKVLQRMQQLMQGGQAGSSSPAGFP
jgi:hypothetical protein